MTDQRGDSGVPAPDHGVYGISVAAELSGIPVQSLRLYERYGLLAPARSNGGTRRYSADDLARLKRISELVDAGINLAGVARILDLEDHNATLSAANTDLRSTNRTLRKGARTAKVTQGAGEPGEGAG
ncbi:MULTISPECIES: helix-turn-helix transcriptional regulator [unclassified Mycobacterium]|uniref:MerR family transcriptional regulator n=1 Tax=unclassified Mycobacterium TaxID=2642494 RepID=UPI0007FE03D4|nr:MULTISPECIES: helix-turn-helix transcriptional regulator [unclassified Mycobacterium]OBB65309.1 MerR family transcriptional regulator [Mycobacterium sp. 852014-50255_SCH5639931]OBB95785.1 MerR family transcriptional regulator [Mycobacterium sp. 852002-30065_SCH5024008]